MTFPFDSVDLPADAIEVGRIGDAWGVKGWFKVLAFSSQPEALFSSRQWYLQPPDRGPRPFDGTLLMRVREAKDHSGSVVATAHDVDDRNIAESLRGSRVFVRRSSFPSTDAQEFYWVDLIGLDVFNREGESLGKVSELIQNAAQAVLVMQYTAGDKLCERMIPFVAAHVDAVDLAAGHITVDWQADY
ncbi:MAG: ribosome maturation factor RimM [Burkholderiaceae bacterium]